MAAGFVHGSRTDMVVLVAEIAALFQNVSALDLRQSGGEDPQGFAPGMHVNRGNLAPGRGRPPFPIGEKTFCWNFSGAAHVSSALLAGSRLQFARRVAPGSTGPAWPSWRQTSATGTRNGGNPG